MTNLDNNSSNDIAKMLHSSSDIFGMENTQSSQTTRSKDQIGVLKSNVIVNLMTIEAARIFDGKSSKEKGITGYIPGLHSFDTRINTVIVPAHTVGCPIARTALIKIESMTDTLEENVTNSFTLISEKIKEYMKKNPQIKINTPTNECPLSRNIAFSTPHSRELFRHLLSFEKVILLQKTYFYLMPKERQNIMDEQRQVTKLFRSIMHLSMQYKTNQATAIDYSEANSKAQEMFNMNDTYFPEAKDIQTSTATSIFYPKFKTANQIATERDERFEKAMADSNESETHALQERAEIMPTQKQETQSEMDNINNEIEPLNAKEKEPV